MNPGSWSSYASPRRIRLLGLLAARALVTIAYQRKQEPAEFYAAVDLRERATAMGASDPSWSPDGSQIAFSLFGSLWRMSASGGPATQLTTGKGYDAGAAWSPNGRLAAFIRGQGPLRGVQLGTQGRLMTVDVSTGDERVLASDLQFVGTPAWSPDNQRLYANAVLGQGHAIYEVPLSGAPKRVTAVPSARVSTIIQRGAGWYYSWYPVAVHPSGLEIIFGGDRDNTPQLWRMPVSDGLVVTSKLTTYKEDDQADIQDVTWENQRSVLYSANLHSGDTNFDLWRWNGSSKRVTRTLYDEYTPRVSPDGKTVLFVSNFLGNPDLFTTTSDFRGAKHVQIESLRFRGGTAKLHVKIGTGCGRARDGSTNLGPRFGREILLSTQCADARPPRYGRRCRVLSQPR